MAIKPDEFAGALFWLASSYQEMDGQFEVVWRSQVDVKFIRGDLSYVFRLVGGVPTMDAYYNKWHKSWRYDGPVFTPAQMFCDMYVYVFKPGDPLTRDFFSSDAMAWAKTFITNGVLDMNGIKMRVNPVNGEPGITFTINGMVVDVSVSGVNTAQMLVNFLGLAWIRGAAQIDCRKWLVIKSV